MLVTKSKSVKLSNGRSYFYQLPWDGRTRLRGSFKSPISFDTETELINEDDPTHIPRLALATASDGYRSLILTPEQVPAFIQAHAREHWLGQNMAFDFWVVHQHLTNGGSPVDAWWRIADEGRLHDTILLDMLIRLAQAAGFEAYAKEDTSLSRRNLDVLAREYCNLRVDKEDPFRLRYGELIGKDWLEVTEEGFWNYAIQDAIVTQLVYRSQIQVADRILQEAKRQQSKDFLPQCHITWGYLTESLQTRASLVLQYMQRRGMRVNPGQAAVFEQQVREQMQAELQRMWEAEPQVFKYREAKKPRRRKNQPELFVSEIPRTPENIIPTKKAGTPSMATKVLATTLQRIAQEAGIRAPQSDGKKKGISLSAKAWTPYRRKNPFLDAWVNFAKLSKSLGFFAVLHDKPVINPRYNVLMRTGRTSCTQPNLQQFPRDSDFRSLFIPRAGFKLLTIDYSYIELRTLAAVCEQRYGKSQLAQVIREGLDPHIYTASLFMGHSYDVVKEACRQEKALVALAKERNQPKPLTPFLDGRQAAKAVGFGVPGGLGAAKLAAYARSSYGVNMEAEQAAQLRHQLVTQVYPELDLYLMDTSLSAMAWNFGVSQKAILQAFHIEEEEPDWVWRMMRAVGKVVRGKPQKADGTPYKEQFVARIWAGLKQLSGSSARLPLWVKQQIKSEKGTPKLEQVLCCGPAVTMTGRVRGSATYTQARNTPFQSLAADGGKLALWDGLMAGFHVVAFIHDEVLVELPEATAEDDARRFEAIMVRAMEKVMNFRLPIACEFHVGDYWQKG